MVSADDKQTARLNVIRDLIARLECPETDRHLASPDQRIVFPYEASHSKRSRLAR